MKKLLSAFALVGLALAVVANGAEPAKPVFRFGLVGLVHDHAQGFIGDTLARTDVQLVGIAESNPELVARYRRQYHLPAEIFFDSLEAMLAQTKVRAVAVCSSTFDHRRVVEICADRGVHVMVEKPLAVDLEQARAIGRAARRAGIEVMVNYETTWYPTTQAVGEIVRSGKEIGAVRKIVVHDGHAGPKEIGCSAEFLAWLTDPVLNGGGAMMDFGCYGADLMTWLMGGQRPLAVTAVTQQIKPAIYPKVDDEATIVLTYPEAQGIIQASWNWPYGRKDLEIYGATGYLLAPGRDELRARIGHGAESARAVPPLEGARANPLAYFAAVVRGDTKPSGLSSLELNLVVNEILDAARESARTGRRVELPKVDTEVRLE